MEPAIRQRLLDKKRKLDELRPFDAGSLKRLEESFNVELTYNSNAIEGNSLSLSETKLVVEEGLTIGGKTMREHLEATNHQKAIEFVKTLVTAKRVEEKDVLELHALILDRIDPNNAGFYRHVGVRISGTTYLPPSSQKVPELMTHVYDMLNAPTKGPDAVEHAARLHLEFVAVHPFVDGNGRTSRLLTNLYLMRNGFPPIIYLRAERKKYITSIMKAQLDHEDEPFVNFTGKTAERSLDMYLDAFGAESGEYLTLEEAAKYSKHDADYLSLLARTGKLGAIKFGRNWKITKEALEEYEKEQGKAT